MNKYLRYFLRVIFLGVIFYLSYQTVTGPRGLKDFIKARKERIRLSLKLQQIKSDKIELEKEILAYRKDPRFLEEEIRRQIKKGRKGEIFYICSDEKSNVKDDKAIK